MTETQQRFLKAIAERLPTGNVVEVRLFPSIRAGQVEAGVAIVAVDGLPEVADPLADALATPTMQPTTDTPVLEALDARASEPAVTSVELPEPAAASLEAGVSTATVPARLSILTARYQLVVKGPDRGRWTFDVVHDADAPLDTVEQVVRGVSRRHGDGGDPELLSSAAFQRAVTEPWWSTTT